MIRSTPWTGLRSSMIQDKLGFRLRFEQTILNHANQQFLCDLLQGNGLLWAQKHSHCSDFARRLPNNMAALRVPELQPQPQRSHPVPEQLYTTRLKLIEDLFAELCKPWQQHVLRAKSQSNPSQPLPVQHPIPREACAQITILRCQSLIRKPV